jgi:hypothetical protein
LADVLGDAYPADALAQEAIAADAKRRAAGKDREAED